MKQTAVEWLIENAHIIPKNELNKREVIQQAKEMEKQQRSYSEEEIIDLLLARDIELNSFGGIDKAKEWFEQFKKEIRL